MHTHDHHHHHGSGEHGHQHGDEGLSRIGFAFTLNFLFTILEIFGGIYTNSVAVLSDALHDLGDTVSLGLSWILERVSRRKRDHRFSYGYRRFSLLAAFINGTILLIGAAFLLREVIPRLLSPESVRAPGVIVLAVIGILFNGAGVLRLKKGHTMNERMLAWHLLEDVFGWTALLVSGILIYFFNVTILDPILSLLFIAVTLWNVIRLLKQTLMIFLQSVPGSMDIQKIEESIGELEGVHSIHDTHLWTMDGDYNVLTTHVVLRDTVPNDQIFVMKQRVRKVTQDHDVDHATIEMERIDEPCHLEDC